MLEDSGARAVATARRVVNSGRRNESSNSEWSACPLHEWKEVADVRAGGRPRCLLESER